MGIRLTTKTDKLSMIKYLKELLKQKDQRIAELEQKCLLYEKEMLNCSQLENGMSLCIVQKQRIAELEQELNSKNMLCENYNCGLNKKIQQLKKELAKLKEKAIVPKFKVGQECYYVYTKSQLRPFNVKIGRITFDTDRKNKIMYDSDFEDDDSYFEKYYGMKECNLFATEQEAIEKLKEMKGNE